MLNSLGRVPFGVWCGAAVIVAAAGMGDGWGFVLGILIIGFTTFTSVYAQNQREQAAQEPEDDGWGTDGAGGAGGADGAGGAGEGDSETR